ncbi:MAG: IS66 family insertion sequence element accessory protein TnpB [Mesorhizobium sp.]|nr:MAG: IS66 family insertion sequence hypothetical protein [Mesorhizobium sp.]RWO45245.1 MAG: IS66 family insertion sequence hypothetical protein [Mesorhizobium sp.]TIN25169.1 MAG: IS66 family insertion sequence element accessory protein TnpB [Mesorhizobium sp.]TIO49112.1 MAG: IS66 family insertion sequence element accessory protein TnpB [Mesorhizobium sp.]TIO57206.1 MAG: IS66 family insertion sequence element accessory protein TnpB [Mesorhizobium sp.]
MGSSRRCQAGGDNRAVTVTRQQIYTWRRELRRKGLLLPSAGHMFLPVDMPVAQSEPRMGKGTDRLSASLFELQLCCGRNLRFDREIDLATLTRLIHAVEAA